MWQQDSGVHRRACADSHDQYITRQPRLHGHLLKANPFRLIQEDAFAGISALWPLVIRQVDALQLEPITHQRETVSFAVLPFATDQGLIVDHLRSGICQMCHGTEPWLHTV